MSVDDRSNTTASPLTVWAQQQRTIRPHRFATAEAGLRFAFYGRISTADHQDRTSSHHWQLSAARDLIAGHSRIVAEYFDVGVSRRIAWPDRPHAQRLLTAIGTNPCPFDAIVVGEHDVVR